MKIHFKECFTKPAQGVDDVIYVGHREIVFDAGVFIPTKGCSLIFMGESIEIPEDVKVRIDLDKEKSFYEWEKDVSSKARLGTRISSILEEESKSSKWNYTIY